MENREEVLLPILIKRTGRIIDGRIDQMLKTHSIARSQYRILYYVAKLGTPTQKELTEVMGVQGSTLTSMVDVMVRKGWVVRLPVERDRRAKSLKLTPKGQKLFSQIPEPSKELDELISRHVTPGQKKTLEDVLGKITEALT